MASQSTIHSVPAGANQHHLRWLAVLSCALFAGVTWQSGFPGSVIALPLIGMFILVLSIPPRRTWPVRITAVLALGAIFTTFLEPGAVNLSVSYVALFALALACFGHGFSNLTAIAATAILHLADRPQSEAQAFQSAHPLKQRKLGSIILPATSAAIFAILLVIANPVIELGLQNMSLGPIGGYLWSIAPLATAVSYFLMRALLAAPQRASSGMTFDGAVPSWHARYFSPASVAFTLIVLNVMFVAQNALDYSYIWQGIPLPPGISYATYTHRGAYALIVTALMAAALIIVALWPGSPTERSTSVRVLVYAWITQNVALVASSVLRTLSYVDAYGLTLLRWAGLLWMGLVAAGLILVAIRIAIHRSNLWLVNGSLIAAFSLLSATGFSDPRSIVANFNVDHALARQDMALPGIDLPYLQSLGPSAIPALRRYDAEILARFRAVNPDYPALLLG